MGVREECGVFGIMAPEICMHSNTEVRKAVEL